MKTLLLAFILSGSFLLGCKKSTEPATDMFQKSRVTFAISNFSQTVSPLSKVDASVKTVGDTLRNYADFLYCHIFSGNNSMAPLVITQTADSPTFGTLTTNLTPGPYTVVIVASKKPTTFQGTSRYSSLTMHPGIDDVFISRFFITVTSENTTETVRLDRWTGAVELNLEDAIPLNVTKLVIETPNNASGWSFSAGQYTGADQTFSSKEFALTDSDKGVINKRFLMHIFNHSTGLTFILKAYDSSGNLVAEKTVPNVNIARNRKTILSGKLFSTITTFNVAVDPIWNTPGAQVGF